MKKYAGLIFIPLTFLLLLTLQPLLFYNEKPIEKVQMVKGTLDATNLDFNGAIFELVGEVMSFESKLIASNPNTDADAPYKWRQFPSPWNADEGISFGSQRFVISGLEPGKYYAFYLMDALTAYRLQVDGKVIAELGTVGKSKEVASPAAKTQMAFFQATDSEAEVIFEVSNFEAHLTGIWQKTLFGNFENIREYEVRVNITDAFVIGAVLFLSIYMWVLYLVLRKDIAILYFSVSCGFITAKVLLSGQQIGFESYGFLTYGMGLRIAYLVIPGILVSFLAFVRHYFSVDTGQRYMKLSILVSGIEALIILLTPQKFYMSTFIGYQFFILMTCVTVIIWVLRAWKNKAEGALISLLGFAIFFVFVINDILYSMLLIDTGYYLGFGLLVLILSQATMVAIRFLRALKTEEYLKRNLEKLVVERTQELEAERNRFENLSKLDSLTRLFNRGYLSEVLGYEFEGFKRYNSTLSILLLDLDHFKKVNDTYGHVVGDEVLKRVADELTRGSRRSDIIGRFGGEEFLIILRFTALEDARIHAEHLRSQIEQLKFETEQGSFAITVSIGIAESTVEMNHDIDLIRKADEALYRAKSTGRNRVC